MLLSHSASYLPVFLAGQQNILWCKRFSWPISALISSLYAQLSKLFELFLEEHSNQKEGNLRNEIGETNCNKACATTSMNWPDYLGYFGPNTVLALNYAVRMLSKSATLLDDSKFIEFIQKCLNQSAILFNFRRSFSGKLFCPFIKIVEFRSRTYVRDIDDPFSTLSKWLSDIYLQSNVRKSWKWAEQFIHKIIEPFIDKYRPLNSICYFPQYAIFDDIIPALLKSVASIFTYYVWFYWRAHRQRLVT